MLLANVRAEKVPEAIGDRGHRLLTSGPKFLSLFRGDPIAHVRANGTPEEERDGEKQQRTCARGRNTFAVESCRPIQEGDGW